MDWHSPREVLAFTLRSTKRIVVLVIGLALVVGGLAMLVLPGPGILVVIAGLAVLATEFVWAERMLDVAKHHASKAKEKAARSLRRHRG
jgi:uncharacterized protein (TIGR02611 family)